MVLQLVREWPPGYGGVERVAHALSEAWQQSGLSATVFCLQGPSSIPAADPLPVAYRRIPLPRLSFGQLLLPLPSTPLLALLGGTSPLHVHLPCPSLLLLSVLARLLHPRRWISLHWHAFLEPEQGFKGILTALYQWLALRWAAVGVQRIVTTSPVLVDALAAAGVPLRRLVLLPCCLEPAQERAAARIAALRLRQPALAGPFRVLFIGRLDSYKRVDWLIEAFAAIAVTDPNLGLQAELHIVGDGPRRAALERQALAVAPGLIRFHGRLAEPRKQALLAAAALLVLPADRCNEAFGIVQLEAMAAGIPSLAFRLPRSGMAWVCELPGLTWPGAPADLAAVLQRLAAEPAWRAALGRQARDRYLQLFARQVWQRQLEGLHL